VNLSHCELCPRRCGVDRMHGTTGYCGAGALARVALVSLHQWEEPCIAGDCGAGTVFFSHCNLGCVYCQNYEISHDGHGIEISGERLAEVFIEQQTRGASTLDLVTPTHYVPQIQEALGVARNRGLKLPVVYNSSAYETVETVEALRDCVDVFLPDLKYIDAETAARYSNAPDYFPVAAAAITKMVEVAGTPIFDADGLMRRGVLVRHLVLPGRRRESMRILDWLWKNLGNQIYLSLMNQFTPMHRTAEYPEINRRLTTFEYDSVVNHALDLGFTHCYIQEGHTASEKFVPRFDGSGVK
jgi:putative pyruvate formate lyase activating enzyme